MAEHRNTVATVRLVLKVCEAKGIDSNDLLKAAGIDPAVVADVDGEVSFTQMRAFWQNAYQLSGDSMLAMHAGQQAEVGAYKCLDYIWVHGATFGEAMSKFIRYFGLINTWIGWETLESGDAVIARMSPKAGVMPPPTPELVWAIFTVRARLLLGERWSPQWLSLPTPEPEDPEPHNRFFCCPMYYDAPTTDFVVNRKSWDAELENADQQLARIMEEHARLLMASRPMPDDLVGQVRQQIVRGMDGSKATREDVAKGLHISVRTLQRRLDEHGIVFSDLVDEVRQELAKKHLQAGELTLTEIGFLLGFSEQSSFTRAFKRWTGKTPLEFRRACSVR
jgi:AraC-like DNA-binding protein